MRKPDPTSITRYPLLLLGGLAISAVVAMLLPGNLEAGARAFVAVGLALVIAGTLTLLLTAAEDR